MNPRDIAKQSVRTHGHLVSIQAYAQGWNTNTLIPEQLTGPLVWLYLWDAPTDWLWTCCIPANLFGQVAGDGFQDQAKQSEFVSSLGATIIEHAENRVTIENGEKALAILTSLYAGTTQTWQLANKFADGGHFVVLSYRKPGSQDVSTRPFALRGDHRIMLPHAQVVQSIEQVHAQDRMRHPEWFR